jgi:ribosomal protein S27AE
MAVDYKIGKDHWNLEWARKFCPKCGSLWKEEAMFCGFCGEELKDRK